MTIRKLIALTLLLALLAPTAAAATPASSTLASSCTPGAAYDPACDVDHDGDVDVIDVQLAAGHWNQSGVWTGGDYWSLGGNAGTTHGVNVLGTTDPVTLTLVVNGTTALRIEPIFDFQILGDTPNLIGGYQGNSVAEDIVGGTIGGGGSYLNDCGGRACDNQVNAHFGTVSGGMGNRIEGLNSWYATVGGGIGNTASEYYATVGGGESNNASEEGSTVGGGNYNTAEGDSSTVGGGWYNHAAAAYATIAGGAPVEFDFPSTTNNRVFDYWGTIGGGGGNVAGFDDGYNNNQRFAVVSGGRYNTASGAHATVGGGSNNTARGAYAAVSGGREADAWHYGEEAHASGSFAVAGDAQTSLYVLRRETGDATLTELFLDGTGARITLAADRVLTFDILVVGSHRFGGGSSAGYQVAGVIRNIGGVTSFVGTPLKTVLGENVAGWDVVVEANDTVDALLVKVQGSADTTIRWVASVRTVEVGR